MQPMQYTPLATTIPHPKRCVRPSGPLLAPPAGRSQSDKSQGVRGTGPPKLPTQNSEEPVFVRLGVTVRIEIVYCLHLLFENSLPLWVAR